MFPFGHQINSRISVHPSQITRWRQLEEAFPIIDSPSLHHASLFNIGSCKSSNCSVVGQRCFRSSSQHEKPHWSNYDSGQWNHPSHFIETETQHQEKHQSRTRAAADDTMSYPRIFQNPKVVHQNKPSFVNTTQVQFTEDPAQENHHNTSTFISSKTAFKTCFLTSVCSSSCLSLLPWFQSVWTAVVDFTCMSQPLTSFHATWLVHCPAQVAFLQFSCAVWKDTGAHRIWTFLTIFKCLTGQCQRVVLKHGEGLPH